MTTLLRLKRELRSGLIKTAGANQAEVYLVLEDGTAYAEPGRLQFSEVNVDQDTGTVTLRAIFPNPDEFLLPGMFVRERIQEGVSAHGLLVPQQGVTPDPQGRPVALSSTRTTRSRAASSSPTARSAPIGSSPRASPMAIVSLSKAC